MSYTRWSSILEDGQVSNWYIYWHAMSPIKDDVRSDQYLAIWYVDSENKIPVLNYDIVKDMYDRDDWTNLGYEKFDQKIHMMKCVKQWIEDVENEYLE